MYFEILIWFDVLFTIEMVELMEVQHKTLEVKERMCISMEGNDISTL